MIRKPLVMVVKSNAPVDDDDVDGGDAAAVKRTIHKPGPAATRRQHRSLMTR